MKRKKKILDTGGGVLNALNYFSNNPFIIINPDTIWNSNYLKKLKLMEKNFFNNKASKCLLLVVKKGNSFDKSYKGDFNLKENLINRDDKNNLQYIYTGLQIVNPEIFSDSENEVFSMNKIWDRLIVKNQLNGLESDINFLHVSNFEIYKSLLKKNFKY